MISVSTKKSLYPVTSPREEGCLKVSPIHTLFYALYGNPEGIPVIVLHGGPGAGCNDTYSCFFDLNRWNVIMFDQRGSMRSIPFGCMEDNTPQHAIKDIEQLRKHLGIKQWMVFGGSWGSTLGLLYGQANPKQCLGFILRGIFLARKEDYLYIFYKMGKTFPAIYKPYYHHIPKNERKDLITAYYNRVMSSDPAIYKPAVRTLISFLSSCWTHPPVSTIDKQDEKMVLSTAKAFMHYSMHGFFLKPNQILSHMKRIASLPGIIIQGKDDVINPPRMAQALHKKWKNSALCLVPKAGHSAYDPPIASALVQATDFFAEKLLN